MTCMLHLHVLMKTLGWSLIPGAHIGIPECLSVLYLLINLFPFPGFLLIEMCINLYLRFDKQHYSETPILRIS